MKEKLSNFLPDLPGMIDLPGSHDNSSLRSLIEKPPILGGSFNPITGTMLAGFRLHTGPVRALLGRRGAEGRPSTCPPGEERGRGEASACPPGEERGRGEARCVPSWGGGARDGGPKASRWWSSPRLYLTYCAEQVMGAEQMTGRGFPPAGHSALPSAPSVAGAVPPDAYSAA